MKSITTFFHFMITVKALSMLILRVGLSSDSNTRLLNIQDYDNLIYKTPDSSMAGM